MIAVVMGVSASGKTTVGKGIAQALGCEFADADDFHSPENRAKMAAGHALTDQDRAPWLERLSALIKTWIVRRTNGVLACSALKASYRESLGVDSSVKFVYIRVSREVAEERLRSRRGHFMNPSLVGSQFDTLEEPLNAITVNGHQTPAAVVADAVRQLRASAPELKGTDAAGH
jgi:gluconokinase